MSEEFELEIECDAEKITLGVEDSIDLSYMNIEDAALKGSHVNYLSFFTRRDTMEDRKFEPVGTEVWLNAESVVELIEKLSDWALKNGIDHDEIAEAVGLEIQFSDDSTFDVANGICSVCLEGALCEEEDFDGDSFVFCEICGSTQE